MGKRCPQCKSPNAAKALYCGACGVKFNDGTKPDKPLPGLPKECPRCFASLSWFASFCYKCGLRQPEADDIEPYEDPDTARLYSWRFFSRMRYVSLGIFLAGLVAGYFIWTGGIEPNQSAALLFSLGMGIAALETLIYAFSVHVNIRMKPSSERMYDLYREISPFLRIVRPMLREVLERLNWATGRISTTEYEKRVKEAEQEKEALKTKIRILENEARMQKTDVRIIRPKRDTSTDGKHADEGGPRGSG